MFESGHTNSALSAVGSADLVREVLCGAVPLYRLIFPPRPGDPIEDAPTAEIDSGDEVYAVGAELVHEGKRWRVTEVPLETQDDEEPAGPAPLACRLASLADRWAYARR